MKKKSASECNLPPIHKKVPCPPCLQSEKKGEVQYIPSQAGIFFLRYFHNENKVLSLPCALYWLQISSTRGRYSRAIISRVAAITLAKLCISLVDVCVQQRFWHCAERKRGTAPEMLRAVTPTHPVPRCAKSCESNSISKRYLPKMPLYIVVEHALLPFSDGGDAANV